MSLRIIKAGLFDTIQDTGRNGFQHLGINPAGAMDRFSAQLANALLGKDLDEAVIEMHFPAGQFLFEKDAVISLTGADFSARINGKAIPLDHPVAVRENSLLQFNHPESGARCYMAVWNELSIDKWLDSYSTSQRAGAGGYQGRAFQRYDQVGFRKPLVLEKILKGKEFLVLPWKSQEAVEKNRNEIQFIIGSEWFWLEKEMQEAFQNHWYQVTNESDRMGYRLAGPVLNTSVQEQLVSTAASFGTVQLLPSGQLILLMADHQTTGGYPRIAHVISAHLPLLAQKKPNDVMRFMITDLNTAEEKMERQQKYLHEIQIASKFRMKTMI